MIGGHFVLHVVLVCLSGDWPMNPDCLVGGGGSGGWVFVGGGVFRSQVLGIFCVVQKMGVDIVCDDDTFHLVSSCQWSGRGQASKIPVYGWKINE